MGETLRASDETELRQVLEKIDIPVPRRTQGRKASHRERNTLVHFLRALLPAGLLEYPLTITKDEKPDLLVVEGDQPQVGWEISEAGDAEHQAAATRLDSAPTGSGLEEAELRLPGEELRGRGYISDEPERLWVEDVLRIVDRKTRSLQDYSITPCDLVIYDNTRYRSVTGWTVDQLLDRLAAGAREWQSSSKFDKNYRRISVVRERVSLYDVTGTRQLLPIYWPEMPRSLPEEKLGIEPTDLIPFCREHHIRKLGFFGSIREERFGPESDVDVLVEFEEDHRIGLIGISGLQIELSEKLGREVDLRTVPDLSRYFREDVFRNKTDLTYVTG